MTGVPAGTSGAGGGSYTGAGATAGGGGGGGEGFSQGKGLPHVWLSASHTRSSVHTFPEQHYSSSRPHFSGSTHKLQMQAIPSWHRSSGCPCVQHYMPSLPHGWHWPRMHTYPWSQNIPMQHWKGHVPQVPTATGEGRETGCNSSFL